MSTIKKRNMAPVSGTQKKSAMGRLLKYVFKYYPGQFALVCIGILLSSLGSVISSYFVGNILISVFLEPSIYIMNRETGNPWKINGVFQYQDNPLEVFNSIRYYGMNFQMTMLVVVFIFILAVLGSFFYNYYMAKISQGVQKRIRDELFSHMESLPVSYFDRHTHGDIMSVYTNDVDSLREMLARSLPQAVASAVTMLVCLVMMMVTDLLLTAVVIGFALIIFFLSKYLARMSAKYFVSMQMELGKTNGYIEEMTTGQKVIKVFNHEEENIEGFRKHNDKLYNDGVRANRFASILMPTVNQLGNFQYALLALVGGMAIVNGVSGVSLSGMHPFEVGMIVSFLLYSKSFIQPIGQISQQLNTIAMALGGASRIFGMIDEPSETDEGYVELVNAKPDEDGNPVECSQKTGQWAWKHPHKDTGKVDYKWLKGKINICDVDFGYSPDKIVLHDITIYAEPGQKVAFVGPTGAGKTTITNLLNRFYDIADGKIRYDDININKIKKSDLRRSLGMVFQDTKLFTGTVKENIRYGNLEATDEEVYKAARLANADSFINQLPQGYDTVLTNGGSALSQGQRQLLAIARAAVANPPVLILDEATSSIDSRTEALVQAGMDAIMKGRTVFVIAHRLSTIKNSDVIMVLDQGKIIERGSHDSLLEQKGKYYQLYTGNAIANQD